MERGGSSGTTKQLRVQAALLNNLGFRDFGNGTTPIPSYERSNQESKQVQVEVGASSSLQQPLSKGV